MTDITFITGNENKVKYMEMWLGQTLQHQKLDLDELQALDLHTVTEHKVRQAYSILEKPVLVEDVSMVMEAMGRLPGPLIKWFLEELGTEGIARLADGLEHRRAYVAAMYGLYDGKNTHFFEGQVHGHIAPEPRGTYGFGWSAVFIPDGTDKTYAQMTDEELKPFSHRAKSIAKLKDFLQSM